MQHALIDQCVDPSALCKRRVKIYAWLRPQQARSEFLLDFGLHALVADRDETGDVGCVVGDQIVTKTEIRSLRWPAR